MAVQFRQIGVPDARVTNAEVRQHLRRAQQRTESLLNRPQLPRPFALLNALKALRRAVQAAYSSLPLQRLTQLRQQLDALYDAVDRGAYFGFHPDALGAHKTLRRFYGDLTGLLVDLTEPPRSRRDPDADSVMQRFLERAQQRGWKVPAVQRIAIEEQDGFVQSIDYLRKVSILPQQLLQENTDFGITTGSIVLMTEQPIPEATLNSWTNHQEVYIVFGHYVVLPNIRLLGLLPHLATIGGSNGNAAIDVNRFVSISELLREQEGATTDNLIRYPRRIRHHYYCPLVDVAGQDRRYFRVWDVLTQQEHHGNAENKFERP